MCARLRNGNAEFSMNLPPFSSPVLKFAKFFHKHPQNDMYTYRHFQTRAGLGLHNQSKYTHKFIIKKNQKTLHGHMNCVSIERLPSNLETKGLRERRRKK